MEPKWEKKKVLMAKAAKRFFNYFLGFFLN